MVFPLSDTNKAFVKLHTAILLAGFTGIIGKLIDMGEVMLVWYRMLMTTVIFGLILLARGKFEFISLRDFMKIGFSGVLICTHWLFFYASIKLSNVSIGVVCFSTIGFFTALTEPLFLRTRFSWRELSYSLLTVFGILLIFSFDVRYRMGIIAGIIGALLAALYTISIKRFEGYSDNATLFYQMGGGTLYLTLILPILISYFDITYLVPTFKDTMLLLCLATFCTIGMSYLLIQSLHHISAFTVNLSYNLEPVYSIAIAMAFLGEARELNFAFYLGLSVIILSVCLQSVWVMREQKKGNTLA